MKAAFPLHNIEMFTHSMTDSGIYVNDLSAHLNENEFIMRRHKHDFYCVIICLEGSGTHEIDFNTYDVAPASVYFMHPGQVHRLIGRTKKVKGFVIFHSRDFYEVGFNGRSLRDFPFYYCIYNSPYLRLSKNITRELSIHCIQLLQEYGQDEHGRHHKICALIDLIYINLSREYTKQYKSKAVSDSNPPRIRRFEHFLEMNYPRVKSPAQYARMMKMSTKQLNRLCRETLGKTTSELILERVLLEAKRELLHKEKNVSEIAAELGYFDTGYFTRIFKKRTGSSPTEFVRTHEIR